MSSVITLSAVGFSWPDGTPVFDGLDLLVGPGRSGLVGVNGSGKSTLLRLVAGALTPSRGHVTVTGEVGYLPQDLSLRTDRTVTDFLGIEPVLRALRAVEEGSADQADFDTIGEDWDVAQRAEAEPGRIGRTQREREDGPAAHGRRAAASRRADQQPRLRVVRRPGLRSLLLPRRAAGRQPRPRLPRGIAVDRTIELLGE